MNNNAIRSDDPQAVEKLREKLTSLEKQQGIMKAINSYYRKNELPQRQSEKHGFGVIPNLAVNFHFH